MNDKIASNGNQFFNVPNTEEGKQFLALARKFLNHPRYVLTPRGRGPRPNHRRSDCPSKMATWFAVYASFKSKNAWQETCNVTFMKSRIEGLEDVIKTTREENKILRENYESILKQAENPFGDDKLGRALQIIYEAINDKADAHFI